MTKEDMEDAIKEIWELFRETDRRFKETEKRFKETDQRLDQRFQETDQRLEQKFKKTDHQLKELGKQIGGLGRKFGGFTEGMAFPSMRRILMERFKAEYVSPRVLVRKNGEMMELDVLAYTNGDLNQVYVVEVKSRLKDEDIQDMLRDLNRFPKFFPQHKDRALYGIIAGVDVTDAIRKKVLDTGLYLATIRDDTFHLEVPKGFKAKRFN